MSHETDRVTIDTGASSSQRSDAASNIGNLILVVELAEITEKNEFDRISKNAFWSAVTDDGQVVLHENKALIGTFDPQLLQDESFLSASGAINQAMIISRKKSIDKISLVALLSDSALKLRIVDSVNRLKIISAVSTFMGIATFFSLLRPLILRPLIRLGKRAETRYKRSA